MIFIDFGEKFLISLIFYLCEFKIVFFFWVGELWLIDF